jgi:ribosomal protein S18 acetylase RimI-like enzyme
MFTHEEIEAAIEQMDSYLNYKKGSDYTVIVAENEGYNIVGFMSFGPAPLAKRVYNLYWIAVMPYAQHRGYGREMMEWLIKRCKVKAVRLIIVETSSQPKYKPTRRFYRSLGFRMASRLPDYYAKGDDRIIYTKSLECREKNHNGRLESTFAA